MGRGRFVCSVVSAVIWMAGCMNSTEQLSGNTDEVEMQALSADDLPEGIVLIRGESHGDATQITITNKTTTDGKTVEAIEVRCLDSGRFLGALVNTGFPLEKAMNRWKEDGKVPEGLVRASLGEDFTGTISIRKLEETVDHLSVVVQARDPSGSVERSTATIGIESSNEFQVGIRLVETVDDDNGYMVPRLTFECWCDGVLCGTLNCKQGSAPTCCCKPGPCYCMMSCESIWCC